MYAGAVLYFVCGGATAPPSLHPHCTLRGRDIGSRPRTGTGCTTCRPASDRPAGPPTVKHSTRTSTRIQFPRRPPYNRAWTSRPTASAGRAPWPLPTCRPTAARRPSTWPTCSGVTTCTDEQIGRKKITRHHLVPATESTR
jgi:hypothetical protein